MAIWLRLAMDTSSTSSEVPDASLVTAGSWGGFFFVALAVAVFFLWRNMNNRLKRLDSKRDLEK